MRINKKFTPFSLEIESREEVAFLQEVLWSTIKARSSILLGRIYKDSTTEKAKYLLSLLEPYNG